VTRYRGRVVRRHTLTAFDLVRQAIDSRHQPGHAETGSSGAKRRRVINLSMNLLTSAQRQVWLIESLPKGPTGKILRRELKVPREAAQT
jgi:hypothetical protein